MVSYQPNLAAADDLDHIFSDGVVRHWLAFANDYYDGLIRQFHLICERPDIGLNVDELRPGI